MPNWFPYVDLACAGAAGVLWYLFPGIGPWPLFLAIAPWFARLVVTGRPGRRTAFFLPLTVFLITAGVAVWSAYDQEAAWSKFWLIVGAVFLYYAFAHGGVFGGTEMQERQAWLLAVFGAGVTAYFIFSHDWDEYPGKVAIFTQIGRAIQAIVPPLPVHRLHPNTVGGFTAMTAPFAAAVIFLAWTRGQRRELVAGSGLLGVILFGLLMSTSRGAWIGLAAAAALTAWWPASALLARGKRNNQRYLYIGLPVGVLLLIIILLIASPAFYRTIVNLLPVTGSGITRAELYRNSLALVNDYPFIGAGLNSFMMLYSTYALLIHVGFSIHGHNLLLDVSIEQGLVAIFALLWMWLLMGEAIWRAMYRGKSSRRSRKKRQETTIPWETETRAKSKVVRRHRISSRMVILLAATMALVIILVHGLVDDAVYGTKGVLLLFVPLSFAAPILENSGKVDRLRQLQTAAVGVALIIAFVYLNLGPIRSMAYANLAAVRQSKAELSEYSWPDWPIQDALRRELDLSQVVYGYEQAIGSYFRSGTANKRLGQIELSLGEYEDALNHLQIAYISMPWDMATRQLLGEAYLANGQLEEGLNLWSGVSNQQGQLDARLFWYEYIGDETRREMIRQAIR